MTSLHTALIVALLAAVMLDVFFLMMTNDPAWLVYCILHSLVAYVLSYKPEVPPRD